MKNQKFFSSLTAVLLVASFSAQTTAQINITPSTTTGQVYLVKAALEGRGVVQPEENQSLQMDVDARFQYQERVIARKTQLKSIRDYELARANIRIDNKPLNSRLADARKVVIVQTKSTGQQIKLASLGGPMTQSEFELVNTPANTLILSEVFAKDRVKVGDTWSPDSQVLAQFFNIESVDKSDVRIELANVKGKDAILVIAGNIEGNVDGAITQIALNGSVRFNSSLGSVTQANLTISQQRDIGLVVPGLDATFKLLISLKPIEQSETLSDAGLASLRKNAGSITDDLLLTPEGSSVSLIHPRQWRVISNHRARTILRYNQNGRMIGQCEILPLPSRLPNQEQTLEQFQAVVKNKLAENTGEIESANASQSENGLEWMRVKASGTTNGVNLQWIYYTLSSPDGRRVQLVFTTEPAYANMFTNTERFLVDSLKFESIDASSTQKLPAQPASAKKTSTEKTDVKTVDSDKK
ncbi:MAG: hypothetical protein P8J91_08305 [Pirellulaceae bacterium]|nr:hypothetical protein [Pirellulaceae bacterium]MDG2103738.1 hypothetical protein [Pirellulaceae bacterium]